MNQSYKEKQIILWRDIKFIVGVILIILSIILGFYGKGLLGLYVIKLFKPVYLLTGLSIYALSWILLFLGIFLVGWETVKMIRYQIHHHVRETVKKTYHHAKQLPRKGYHYTKKLHRKLTNRN